jgi:NAD(P)-dependent dehydrogenase (short-subunit alcohol dehydrogenase family)
MPPMDSAITDLNLRDRNVVVTGAFGALGAVVSQSARAAGATVAAVGRAPAAKAPPFGAGIIAFGGIDLAKPDETAAGFQSICDRLGGIDALVNIAGAFRFEKIAGGGIEIWDQMYEMNVRTAVNATRSALPFILKRSAAHGAGRIVNIGAAAASHAGSGMGAYAASKAGVARFTEALAAELKDSGVTANALLPSIIDTAPNRADMPKADFNRWVKPEQLADLIVYLLSSRSSAITGALIPVTGRV